MSFSSLLTDPVQIQTKSLTTTAGITKEVRTTTQETTGRLSPAYQTSLTLTAGTQDVAGSLRQLRIPAEAQVRTEQRIMVHDQIYRIVTVYGPNTPTHQPHHYKVILRGRDA